VALSIERMTRPDANAQAQSQPNFVDVKNDIWTAQFPYQLRAQFDISKLRLDEWDRAHGRSENGIPFVMSRAAQAQFFDLVDELDDDGFTVDGKYHHCPPWMTSSPEQTSEKKWSGLYQTEDTHWDLKAPSPVLVGLMAKIKISKSRIAVLACGTGHDAAWLASQGHLVTGFDFSPLAIEKARAEHADLLRTAPQNLSFEEQDVFNISKIYHGQFDLVFDHTCHCAIAPEKRNDLVKSWRQLLHERGHLLGIFFAMDRPEGPPYGGSEFELQRRLTKKFRPLLWNRATDSVEDRYAREFWVYAEKI
jgi:SAM-dependent methyltransferase